VNLFALIEAFRDYLEKGGIAVMGPLALATCVLWYTLGLRFVTLQRGSRHDARRIIEAYLRGSRRKPRGIIDRACSIGALLAQAGRTDLRKLLDDGFAEIERDLNTGRVVVKGIVSVAPLAGLLGTVTGMIETFDSLGDMSLHSSSGGIAGGISQALFTTQMGLSVAVPGVIVGLLLDRRQQGLADELEKVKDILCHRFIPRGDQATAQAPNTP